MEYRIGFSKKQTKNTKKTPRFLKSATYITSKDLYPNWNLENKSYSYKRQYYQYHIDLFIVKKKTPRFKVLKS